MYLTPVFLGSASFVFLNFLLPVYTRQLGADAISIGGMYTAFILSMLVFRPIVGRALDRYGRRWFFTSAFLFYMVAMWTFSGADELADFFLGRSLQGIGAALMWVSARTIVVDIAAAGERGRQMGRLASRSVQGAMLGAFYGFTLLGMFPLPDAWQLAFAGYAVVAGLGFIVSLIRVRETRSRSDAGGRDDELPVGGDLYHLFGIVFVSGFATTLIEPIYLIYLQDTFELSPIRLAFAFFPAGIVFAVLPNYTGRLVDRFGRGRFLMLGFASAGLVSLVLPWLPGILWVAAAYTLLAVGRSMSLPAEDALVGDLAPDAHVGRIVGYKEAAASAGAALGPPIGGWVYETAAPELAFVMNGVLLTVAVVLAWLWFGKAETLGARRA
jgi:DHA1 family multidrug resistance protein-like MFS transporter